VFNNAIAINHPTCLVLAAFHNAKSFQTADQINIPTKNKTETPSSVASPERYSCILKYIIQDMFKNILVFF
jgi:hypothetical protein